MIIFTLTLYLCVSVDSCTWIEVDDYVSERECRADGPKWEAEIGTIEAWRCIARIRGIDMNHNRG